MTELTFTILKYILLLALLAFAWLAIHSLHNDIAATAGVPNKRNRKARKKNKTKSPLPLTEAPSAVPVVPVPVTAASSEPTLLVVIDGPLAGSTIPLTGMPITLGRAPTNRLVLDDEYVSGSHAQVFLDPATHKWMLEDLGSTNGTYIDGQRLTGVMPLRARIPVRVGATSFELR